MVAIDLFTPSYIPFFSSQLKTTALLKYVFHLQGSLHSVIGQYSGTSACLAPLYH